MGAHARSAHGQCTSTHVKYAHQLTTVLTPYDLGKQEAQKDQEDTHTRGPTSSKHARIHKRTHTLTHCQVRLLTLVRDISRVLRLCVPRLHHNLVHVEETEWSRTQHHTGPRETHTIRARTHTHVYTHLPIARRASWSLSATSAASSVSAFHCFTTTSLLLKKRKNPVRGAACPSFDTALCATTRQHVSTTLMLRCNMFALPPTNLRN